MAARLVCDGSEENCYYRKKIEKLNEVVLVGNGDDRGPLRGRVHVLEDKMDGMVEKLTYLYDEAVKKKGAEEQKEKDHAAYEESTVDRDRKANKRVSSSNLRVNIFAAIVALVMVLSMLFGPEIRRFFHLSPTSLTTTPTVYSAYNGR